MHHRSALIPDRALEQPIARVITNHYGDGTPDWNSIRIGKRSITIEDTGLWSCHAYITSLLTVENDTQETQPQPSHPRHFRNETGFVEWDADRFVAGLLAWDELGVSMRMSDPQPIRQSAIMLSILQNLKERVPFHELLKQEHLKQMQHLWVLAKLNGIPT